MGNIGVGMIMGADLLGKMPFQGPESPFLCSRKAGFTTFDAFFEIFEEKLSNNPNQNCSY